MGVRRYGKHIAVLGVALGVALLVGGLVMVPAAGAKPAPPGCNGDIKTHDGNGEPSPITKDEPKVCGFHLHAFNFDPQASVIWRIETQPGGATVDSGSLNIGNDGAARTGEMNLADGMYKVYWHQDGCPGGDKHKVFKVECPPPTYCVSGAKWNDLNGDGDRDGGEAGLSGWTIQLRQGGNVIATTTTDANGDYEFCSLAAGNYTVNEVLKNGWTQTFPTAPGTQAVNITNADVTGKDFGNQQLSVPKYYISGMKWNDRNGDGDKDGNEPGLSGWTIELRQNGNVIATTTTDANGDYEFINLDAGTYTVNEVMQGGWTRTFPTAPGNYVVQLGPSATDKDFGNRQVPTTPQVGNIIACANDTNAVVVSQSGNVVRTVGAPSAWGTVKMDGFTPGKYTVSSGPNSQDVTVVANQDVSTSWACAPATSTPTPVATVAGVEVTPVAEVAAAELPQMGGGGGLSAMLLAGLALIALGTGVGVFAHVRAK